MVDLELVVGVEEEACTVLPVQDDFLANTFFSSNKI